MQTVMCQGNVNTWPVSVTPFSADDYVFRAQRKFAHMRALDRWWKKAQTHVRAKRQKNARIQVQT